MPPPVVIKIGAVADLSDILKTKAALKSLGDNGNKLNRVFRGLAQGVMKFMKLLGKISFIGMAIDIGLVSIALASVRLAMAVGRWTVKTYEAALRGLGAAAGMAATALASVVAAMREFAEVSFAPMVGGIKQARQALRGSLGDDLLSFFGVEGVQAAVAELARGGVDINRSYSSILRSLGNFAPDAQTLGQLTAVYAEVNRQGKVTEEVMARMIQINPVFARSMAEMFGKKGQAYSQVQAEDIAMQFAAAGKVSAADFAKMFTGELDATDLWEGQLEKLNDTLFGQVKGMVARLYQFFADLGGPFLKPLKDALSVIENVTRRTFVSLSGVLSHYGINKMIPGLMSGYDKFLRWVSRKTIAGLEGVDGFVGRMKNMWMGVKDFFIDMARTFEPLEEGGRIIGEVLGPALREIFGSGGFGSMIKDFNQLLQENRQVFQEHGAELARFVRSFMDIFRQGQKAFTEALPTINKFLSDLTENLMPLIRDMISTFKDAVIRVLPALGSAFKTVADAIRPLLGLLQSIIGLGGLPGALSGGMLLAAPWLLGFVGKGGKTAGAARASRLGLATGAYGKLAQGAGGGWPLALILGLAGGGAAAGGALGGGANVMTALALTGMLGGAAGGAFLPRTQQGVEYTRPMTLAEARLAGPAGLAQWTAAAGKAPAAPKAFGSRARLDAYEAQTLPVSTMVGAGEKNAFRGAMAQWDYLSKTPEGVSGRFAGSQRLWSLRQAMGPGFTPMMQTGLGMGLMYAGSQMEPGWQATGVQSGGMAYMMKGMGGKTGGRIGAGMFGYQMGQTAGAAQNGGGVAASILGGVAMGAATGGPWGALIGGVTAGIGALVSWRAATERLKKAQEAATDAANRYSREIKEAFSEGGSIDVIKQYRDDLGELTGQMGEEYSSLADQAKAAGMDLLAFTEKQYKTLSEQAKAAGVDVVTYVDEFLKSSAELYDDLNKREDTYNRKIGDLMRVSGMTAEELNSLSDVMGVDLTDATMTLTDALIELGYFMEEAMTGAQIAARQISNFYDAILQSPGYKALASQEAWKTQEAIVQEVYDAIRTEGAAGPTGAQFTSMIDALITEFSLEGLEPAEMINAITRRLQSTDVEYMRHGGKAVWGDLYDPEVARRGMIRGIPGGEAPEETARFQTAWFDFMRPALEAQGKRGLGLERALATGWEEQLLGLEEFARTTPELYTAHLLNLTSQFEEQNKLNIQAEQVNITAGVLQGMADNFIMPETVSQFLTDLPAQAVANALAAGEINPSEAGLLSGLTAEKLSHDYWYNDAEPSGEAVYQQMLTLLQPYFKDRDQTELLLYSLGTGGSTLETAAEAWADLTGKVDPVTGEFLELPPSIQATITYLDVFTSALETKAAEIAAAQVASGLIPTIVNKKPGGVFSGKTGTDTSTPRGPLGDTASGRFGRTLGFHAGINSRFAGGRLMTSGLRNWNLGSINSDHLTGRAYDLTGDNLGAYANEVKALGGFAEFHGDTSSRHLHVVAPIGDRSSPANAGGMMVPGIGNVEININGANASPEAIANAVMARLRRLQRDAEERA